MKLSSASAKTFVVGSLVAVVPLLFATATPVRAESTDFGSCDASGSSHCCVCGNRPGGGYACTSISEGGVWSCTSEFCSGTGCLLQ